MSGSAVPGTFDVELASGRYFNVLNPDHHALSLDDVATCLSKTSRYGGACEGFASVAEHAVLVAGKLRRLGASLSLQLAGLHHDDPEFCLSDLQRPVKLALRALLSEGKPDPYTNITVRLEHAIWRAFGQVAGVALWTPGDEHAELVKDVDVWACAFEARHIMPSRGEHWEQTWLLSQATRPIPEHDEDTWHGWEWRDAREQYILTHLALANEARWATRVAA